ncbi:MAG TPA: TatD family hydrolase [bacterium]|jgi:TatD DNase family protein|nr:TatD family hydrolase [bacterium]
MAALIDSHCHLDDERLLSDEENVLLKAKDHGVELLVTIGTDEKTSAAAAQIASRYPGRIYHTVGAHPSDVDRFGEPELAEIERLARETKPRAIGEIGLDYYHDSNREKQVVVFERMIKLARSLSLPIVIHDRDAHEDIHRILGEKARDLKIMMHCYSAGPNFVDRFMDLGCLFSIAGPVTFKNGQDHRDAVAKIPLDRLVVETDSPYLTPHPFRGQRNEPAYVKFTAEKVAEVKGVTLEVLAEATTRNAKKFFDI